MGDYAFMRFLLLSSQSPSWGSSVTSIQRCNCPYGFRNPPSPLELLRLTLVDTPVQVADGEPSLEHSCYLLEPNYGSRALILEVYHLSDSEPTNIFSSMCMALLSS